MANICGKHSVDYDRVTQAVNYVCLINRVSFVI